MSNKTVILYNFSYGYEYKFKISLYSTGWSPLSDESKDTLDTRIYFNISTKQVGFKTIKVNWNQNGSLIYSIKQYIFLLNGLSYSVSDSSGSNEFILRNASYGSNNLILNYLTPFNDLFNTSLTYVTLLEPRVGSYMTIDEFNLISSLNWSISNISYDTKISRYSIKYKLNNTNPFNYYSKLSIISFLNSKIFWFNNFFILKLDYL